MTTIEDIKNRIKSLEDKINHCNDKAKNRYYREEAAKLRKYLRENNTTNI